MNSEWLELRIRGVSVERADVPPLVLLEDATGLHHLRIPVGPFEASAVIMELEGICPPRPLTHDLLAELFSEAGFLLDKVELFGQSGGLPRARLSYRRGLKHLAKEIRPSDALALALRLHAPILADPSLLGSARKLQRAQDSRSSARVLHLNDWKQRSVGS